ncbi:MarR family winged helix-turn-helix transcriptional regulator [Bradyrhizobium genosp. P]|uniref:MarR family winged helix-turn-helix transcriptional regulator n=1 Tax=Bradyrhizobium genosp. P TaxID=83641 RepID=UPI003CF8B848
MSMEPEKTAVRKRTAKRPRRAARVAKSSRPPPRATHAEKPARTKPPALPLALGDLSHLLGYRLRRAQLWVFKDFGRQLSAFEISPAQFSVLCVIEANPGVNQLAIAQLLSIERAGLGRLVDHLEARDLVRRTASTINRRYYVLFLTDQGAALLGRIRPAVAENDRRLAAKIGPRAYRELLRALSIFLQEA